MQVTINTDDLSTELLIAIANAYAKEIENPAYGFTTATPRKYTRLQFTTICNVIESRLAETGVGELSDHVVCPENY